MRPPVRALAHGARDLVTSPAGLVAFRRTGTTPTGTYRVMRKSLSVAPRLAPQAFRLVLPTADVTPEPSPSGVLGTLSAAELTALADGVRQDGFVRFERPVEAATCAAIEAVARTTPAELMPAPARGPAMAVFDEDQPLAPKHHVPEAAVVAVPEVQALLVDPTLRALAGAYLGCQPVCTLTATWWSSPSPDGPCSEIAQLFHEDRDHPSFLKFFLYVTDVDGARGPHVYVRGSHRGRPGALRADRRFGDDEVARHYRAEDIVALCGPRGTLFAADTSGLHKGLPPVAGSRLVFQIEFADSLFGAPYRRVSTSTLTTATATDMARHPHTYRRFLAEEH